MNFYNFYCQELLYPLDILLIKDVILHYYFLNIDFQNERTFSPDANNPSPNPKKNPETAESISEISEIRSNISIDIIIRIRPIILNIMSLLIFLFHSIFMVNILLVSTESILSTRL